MCLGYLIYNNYEFLAYPCQLTNLKDFFILLINETFIKKGL